MKRLTRNRVPVVVGAPRRKPLNEERGVGNSLPLVDQILDAHQRFRYFLESKQDLISGGYSTSDKPAWDRVLKALREVDSANAGLYDKLIELRKAVKDSTPESASRKKVVEAVPPVGEMVKHISDLLVANGMLAAARDVDDTNYKTYARWLIRDAEKNSRMTDPTTRQVTVDPKGAEYHKKLTHSFKSWGLI